MTHLVAKFLTFCVLFFSSQLFAQENASYPSQPPQSTAVVCLSSTFGAIGNIGLNALEGIYIALQKTTNFIAGSALESTTIVAQRLGYNHLATNLRSPADSQISLNLVVGDKNIIDYYVNLAMLAQGSSDNRFAFQEGIVSSDTYLAIGSAALDMGEQLYESSILSTANIMALVVAGFSQEKTADIEEIKEFCSDMGYVATTVVGYKLLTRALPSRELPRRLDFEKIPPTIDTTKMEGFVSEMGKKMDLEKSAQQATVNLEKPK